MYNLLYRSSHSPSYDWAEGGRPREEQPARGPGCAGARSLRAIGPGEAGHGSGGRPKAGVGARSATRRVLEFAFSFAEKN